ncbi:MAG TPA: DUF1343 domain-containing protein [Vicinamibacterales bacterium]|jgi:uncharacterized protein YbbC (DUF1343 family)
MRTGLDRLLCDDKLLGRLIGRRVALLANPASMTSISLGFQHALDALVAKLGTTVSAAFGPQHGMRGDKQYNMQESATYRDPEHGIPVFSLYGDVRRPTADMLDTFDVLLFDLQDVGWRGYTWVATLLYMLEACASTNKAVWVLDRPNPAGRVVEGKRLVPGEESFVGVVPIPQRHGLTLGEIARYMVSQFRLDVSLEVIAMEGYAPDEGPGFGWPADMVWVNPSPAIANLNCVRCYTGTVLLEGTNLSEGRGTTTPLEVIGAPNFPANDVIAHVRATAPQFCAGCHLRPCFFEPFFDKYRGTLCAGIQIHANFPGFVPSDFKPYRLTSAVFKALRTLQPDFELWRDFHYEYEPPHRRPIDVINGGPSLREWVDDPQASVGDWDELLRTDEADWIEERRDYVIYSSR